MTNILLRQPFAAGMLALVAAAIITTVLLVRGSSDQGAAPFAGQVPTAPATAPETPPTATTPPAAAPAAPIAWTLPAGWAPAPDKPMRLAVFTVAGGNGIAGECGVFLFPGGGDRLSNVNRWRGQVGLAPIDAIALERELVTDACAFGPFAWLAVRGERKAFLAAIVATPDGQCFVKLEGPPDHLDGMRAGFLTYCRSLRPASRP